MDTHTPNPADPIRVTAHRAIPDSPFPPSLASLFHTDLATDLRRARLLADWLDTKFEFAGFRFGFDTIVGLIPLLGDLLDTAFRANIRNVKMLEKPSPSSPHQILLQSNRSPNSSTSPPTLTPTQRYAA